MISNTIEFAKDERKIKRFFVTQITFGDNVWPAL